VKFDFEEMTETHWPQVAEIFKQGIETREATFATEPPSSWGEWDAAHLKECRLVAVLCDQVVGWAALSPVSSRCYYRGVVEVSVYVRNGCRGAGIGTALLKALVWESEEAGIWTLQSLVFPENEVSIAVHRKCGFRELGVMERPGRMGDRWRDVVILERRSDKVGTD
jgi:phosphinothricin acetyltransferase